MVAAAQRAASSPRELLELAERLVTAGGGDAGTGRKPTEVGSIPVAKEAAVATTLPAQEAAKAQKSARHLARSVEWSKAGAALRPAAVADPTSDFVRQQFRTLTPRRPPTSCLRSLQPTCPA
jgi:hypothetical protein